MRSLPTGVPQAWRLGLQTQPLVIQWSVAQSSLQPFQIVLVIAVVLCVLVAKGAEGVRVETGAQDQFQAPVAQQVEHGQSECRLLR